MNSLRHFACLAVTVPTLSLAQNPSRPAHLRVQSDLVLINVLVTDSHGKPVTGLSASRFHLSEEGREQVIKYCFSEDVPVSIGLVLDASASMYGKLGLLKEAALRFVRAANPADEYFVVRFQARPELVLPFTADSDRLVRSTTVRLTV